jgi:hypothetical protein
MKPGWEYETAAELLEDVTRDRALLVEVLTYVQNEETNRDDDNAASIYRFLAKALAAIDEYQASNSSEPVLRPEETVPDRRRRC